MRNREPQSCICHRAPQLRRADGPIDPAKTVGGQAVIEGVMMRAPGAWSVAVRQPDDTIVARRHVLGRLPTATGPPASRSCVASSCSGSR